MRVAKGFIWQARAAQNIRNSTWNVSEIRDAVRRLCGTISRASAERQRKSETSLRNAEIQVVCGARGTTNSKGSNLALEVFLEMNSREGYPPRTSVPCPLSAAVLRIVHATIRVRLVLALRIGPRSGSVFERRRPCIYWKCCFDFPPTTEADRPSSSCWRSPSPSFSCVSPLSDEQRWFVPLHRVSQGLRWKYARTQSRRMVLVAAVHNSQRVDGTLSYPTWTARPTPSPPATPNSSWIS